MSDVIVAITPAPGHEALVAEGPQVAGCVPERPMTIDVPAAVHPCSVRCWRVGVDIRVAKGARCPECGSPGLTKALVLHAPGDPKLGMLRAMDAAFGADAEAAVVRWDGEHEAFALAHLLMQRGIAAEVIVLPADKAKE